MQPQVLLNPFRSKPQIFIKISNRKVPSLGLKCTEKKQSKNPKKDKIWIREEKKEEKKEKNVNRFPKQQCVLVFADSFAGALLIRMRATATRQHQRKNADSLIIIFYTSFSFHFFLFIFFCCCCWCCCDDVEKLLKEKRKERAMWIFFPLKIFYVFSHSPFARRSFFVISFLCERERRCLRLNDHWDEVRKVSFVVSRRFKLRKKFIIQFANERKKERKEKKRRLKREREECFINETRGWNSWAVISRPLKI